MNNTDKLLPRERVYLMSAVAERDKLIGEQQREIAHYKRQYELAVERRLRERRERRERSERRAKLNLSYALLLIAGMALIPWALWLVDTAFKSFWLWAN